MSLLDALTQDAATLVESELPAPASIRTVLGALVKHVEALQIKVLGPAEPAVAAVETAAAHAVEQAVNPADATAAAATPAETNALQAERDQAVTDLLARLKALL